MLTESLQYAVSMLSRKVYFFGYLNEISLFTIFLHLFFTKQHTTAHFFSRAQLVREGSYRTFERYGASDKISFRGINYDFED